MRKNQAVQIVRTCVVLLFAIFVLCAVAFLLAKNSVVTSKKQVSEIPHREVHRALK